MPSRLRAPRDIGGTIDAVRKLPAYARLVWALARDRRVPGQQKLILAGIVGYLLLPFDLVPDLIPIIGQLDDLAVVLLGLDLFIRAAPEDVVAEHLQRISKGKDDLTHDMEQVQSLLGERFATIRDDLQGLLARQRKRFRTVDDAADALESWHGGERPERTRRKGESE